MTTQTPRLTTPSASWSTAVELRLGLHIGEYAPGGGAAAQWDIAKWDEDSWGTASGTDPDNPDAIWQWLECDVQHVATHRGKAAWSNQYDAGSLTATLYNLTGVYDLDFDNPGLAVSLDVGRLIRLQGRPIAVGVTEWSTVFTGQVTGLREAMTPAGVATVTVTAADAFSYLGRRSFIAEGSAIPVEPVVDRLDRILDKAQWPDYRRDLDWTDSVDLHDATLASNALGEMKLSAESTGGEVFIDERGRVAYRPRNWNLAPDIDPAGILTGERGAVPDYDADPPVLCLADPLILSRAIDRVVNTVELTSGAGYAGVWDSLSEQRYGPRDHIRTNLVTESHLELQVMAGQILARGKDARTRLDAAGVVIVTADDAAWTLARTYGDRIELHYTHPVFGWTVDLQSTIIGIDHEISDTGWTVIFTTDHLPTT